MLAKKPWWFWAQILLSTLFIAPLWLLPYLPLGDWPNHLASAHLLSLHNSGVETYVVPNSSPLVPNSTVFLILAALAPYFGVETAGRLLLSIYILALPLCFSYFLGSIKKGLEPYGIFAFMLAYNWIFIMGFLNNALSFPIFLFSAGYWLRNRNSGSAGFAAVFLALSFANYLTHLFSLLALFATIGFVRLHNREFKPRLLALDAIAALLPLALSLPSLIAIAANQAGSGIIWGTLPERLLYLALFPPNPAIFIILLLTLIFFFAISGKGGRTSLPSTPDFWPVGLGLFFIAGAFCLPISFPSWQYAIPRLIPYAYFFLLSGLFLAFHLLRRRHETEVLSAIVAFSLVSFALSALDLHYDSAQVGEFASLSMYFEPRSAVFVFGEGVGSQSRLGNFQLLHAWGYWVIEKEVFSPYLFSYGYSPIAYSQENMRGQAVVSSWLANLADAQMSRKYSDSCRAWVDYYAAVDWHLIGENYDYVVYIGGNCTPAEIPSEFVKIGQPAEQIEIYKKA